MPKFWRQSRPGWYRRSNNLVPLVSDKRPPHSGYYEELSATADFRFWPEGDGRQELLESSAVDPLRPLAINEKSNQQDNHDFDHHSGGAVWLRV
jgi:hypothetical protein